MSMNFPYTYRTFELRQNEDDCGTPYATPDVIDCNQFRTFTELAESVEYALWGFPLDSIDLSEFFVVKYELGKEIVEILNLVGEVLTMSEAEPFIEAGYADGLIFSQELLDNVRA